jgi:AcrR family transcriptional regulator
MRRVAADLGTGAASLYRYLDSREDLLDLMTDATAAGYTLSPPTGDWLADLVGLGEQARAIMRRHPWLPTVVITRPVLGPNGVAILEHVLHVLDGHPADLPAKLEAFAMLNTITAVFVQHELAGGSAAQQRSLAYLQYVLAAGERPRLSQLLAPAQARMASPADPYPGILARVLTGLLVPERPAGPDSLGPQDLPRA